MKYVRLIFTLFKPRHLWNLGHALRLHGINLMALLAYAKANTPETKALRDEQEDLSYSGLYRESTQLATYLRETYDLQAGSHVLMVCRNSASFIKSLFAVSNLGAHIYLVNPGLNSLRYAEFLSRKNYHLLICDEEADLDTEICKVPVLYTQHASKPSISSLKNYKPGTFSFIKSKKSGHIIVLTSGSTGTFKEAPRKPSTSAFIDPLLDITAKLKIQNYKSIFIAVPVFHGFGLAALFMAMFFSKTVFIHKRFKALAVLDAVEKYRVECLALVPLMLHKLVQENISTKHPVKCIISGGDKLNPAIVRQTQQKLGSVLYNLYGTSEAGVCILAVPADLARFPDTIGKKIHGSQVKLLDVKQQEVTTGTVGEVCVSADWTMESAGNTFVRTGDLAVINEEGFYFLKGRKDDMIVVGGENVFPIELERVVYQYHGVEWARVESYEDKQQLTRLKLTLVFTAGQVHTGEQVMDWLMPQIPKHLKPEVIEVLDQIPVSKLMS